MKANEKSEREVEGQREGSETISRRRGKAKERE